MLFTSLLGSEQEDNAQNRKIMEGLEIIYTPIPNVAWFCILTFLLNQKKAFTFLISKTNDNY